MKKLMSVFLILIVNILTVYSQEISKTKLSNGHTVIVKEIRTNPIVIIDTWVKTGSIDEDDNNNGVAHFLEHLFFKGSKNFPYNEFDKILESKGAETNAATSKDYTHFYILIPSKDFETALKLHADMLTQPMFPDEEINKERNVVIREIERNNDNPSRILNKKFNIALYPTHPYKREVIGTKEIISNIAREDIIKFYKNHYSAENLITVIVGDVEPKYATELVKKYFANSTANEKAVKNCYKSDKKPDKQIYINSKEDINTSDLVIGYKCGLKVTDVDSYALDILAAVLGGGKSSRLYKKMKDDKQIVQSVFASNVSMKEDSVFMIGADLDEENIDQAVKNIFCEIENIKKQKISNEELQRAKKIIAREILYSRESVSDNASEIGYSTLLTGDWNYSEEYLKNIEKISSEEIQKATIKYLDSESAIIASVTPKDPNKSVKTHKVINTEKKQDFTIEGNTYYKPSQHKAKSCKKIGRTNRCELDNGAVLIADKHNNNEIIAIDIKVKGGAYTEKTPGIAKVTALALNEGTEKYPKDTFAKITEENGIKINAYDGAEFFGISLRCTKPDLPLALDLLYEVINRACLEDAQIEKIKQDIIYNIKQSRNNASNVAFEEASNALWGDSPYNRTGKLIEKTIPYITKKDVDNYYKNLFDAKNTIIGVSGNVNIQDLINYFSEVISSKNRQKIDYKNYIGTTASLNKNEIINNKQGQEAAWIVYAWQTDGTVNAKDRITLKVIDAILGSGMSSKLFSKVRAEKGLAYAVGTSTSFNVNKGAFYMYIGTEPVKAEEAKKALITELNELKKGNVTEKELDDAKNKLKGEAILKMETNSEKAYILTICEQNGKGVDYYYDKFNKEVDSVTVSDIISTANKYFSRPYVLSEVLPQKNNF